MSTQPKEQHDWSPSKQFSSKSMESDTTKKQKWQIQIVPDTGEAVCILIAALLVAVLFVVAGRRIAEVEPGLVPLDHHPPSRRSPLY